AKNSLEKSTAEDIAMRTKGVKNVKNEIAVRP
ncbi:MAG TPA: BON domain-containing protein, partial [Caldimonas sp.]